MARHSHWHNIQLNKGKTDSKRAGVFSKLVKGITVAAREGGDMTFNFKLRMAVEAAKAVSMPKDNIDRAIARATGGEGAALTEAVYEGFAPGGVAIVVRCLTDNPTRTVSEVKMIASKNGGTIGAPGSVMWMFERRGVVHVGDLSKVKDRDALEMALIEGGAQDIQSEGEGLRVIGEPTELKKLTESVEAQGLKPTMSGFEYIAKTTTTVPDAEAEAKVTAFIELLEDNDDVDAVFTNEA